MRQLADGHALQDRSDSNQHKLGCAIYPDRAWSETDLNEDSLARQSFGAQANDKAQHCEATIPSLSNFAVISQLQQRCCMELQGGLLALDQASLALELLRGCTSHWKYSQQPPRLWRRHPNCEFQ